MIQYHVNNKLALLEYPRISVNSEITRTLVDDENKPSETIYMSRNVSSWTQYTENVVHALNIYNLATIELIGKDCYNNKFDPIDEGMYAIAVVRDNYSTDDGKPVITLRIVLSDDPTGAKARELLIKEDDLAEDEKAVYYSFSLSDNGVVSKNIEKYTYDKFCFTVSYTSDPVVYLSSKEITSVQGYNYGLYYGVVESIVKEAEKADGEEATEDVREEEGLSGDDLHDESDGAE